MDKSSDRAVQWLVNPVTKDLEPHVGGRVVAFAPQAGSQEAFLTCPIFEVLYHGTRGPGKEIDNDELVLTTLGWVRHGDLTTNHSVITPMGRSSKVTSVVHHPNSEAYRITFDDGASVVAGGEHLWKCRTDASADKEHLWFVHDTNTIRAALACGIRVFIPLVSPLIAKEETLTAIRFLALEAGRTGTLSKEDAERIRSAVCAMGVKAVIIPPGLEDPRSLPREHSLVVSAADREIVRIEPVGRRDCSCIAIDDPERLYVVTKNYIVTHNSAAAIIDFSQHVGKGFGSHWNGIIFRRTFPELGDIIELSKRIFSRVWPSSRFHETKKQFEWPSGEILAFRHADNEDDYWSYHGRNVPWILWEELSTWPSDALFKRMMSVCRSPIREIPRKYRATTNPHGVGHSWIKRRYELEGARAHKDDPQLEDPTKGKIVGPVLTDENGVQRVAIRGTIHENKVLMNADPGYLARLAASAPSPAALRAWVYGDWSVTSGGLLDDLWAPTTHVVPDIPVEVLPKGWRISRSYDHGQSRPFSVLWWARSDGTPAEVPVLTITEAGPKEVTRLVGEVEGDEILIAEWYGVRRDDKGAAIPNKGLNLDATEIATGIKQREERWGIAKRVRPGPADNSIFDKEEGRPSVANDMRRAARITWAKSDKGPGSRVQGWMQIRKMLRGALGLPPSSLDGSSQAPNQPPTPQDPSSEEGGRSTPGLFITASCTEFIRTVPTLPRDRKNEDDCDTEAEDHAGDAARYYLRAPKQVVISDTF